jgi:hypothetical protein
MMAGVKDSAVFVLFLTDGTTERFYVQLEIREAFRLQKPILMIEETDDRFGKPNYAKESKLVVHTDQVTGSPVLDEKQLAWLFSEVTAIPVRRQAHELAGFLDEVERQTSLAIGGAGKRPPAELRNATPSAAVGLTLTLSPTSSTPTVSPMEVASPHARALLAAVEKLGMPLQYLQLMADDGVDSVLALQATPVEDLKSLGLKPGHARALKAYFPDAPVPEGVPPQPQPEPEPAYPTTPQAAAADGSLVAFLSPWYDQLRADLDALGVDEVDDLRELEAEEIEQLVNKLKAVQARKLRKKLASVGAGAEA